MQPTTEQRAAIDASTSAALVVDSQEVEVLPAFDLTAAAQEAASTGDEEDVCVICLEEHEDSITGQPDASTEAFEVVYEKTSGEWTSVAFDSRPLGMVTVVGLEPVTVKLVV